jgi:hypothetical protein
MCGCTSRSPLDVFGLSVLDPLLPVDAADCKTGRESLAAWAIIAAFSTDFFWLSTGFKSRLGMGKARGAGGASDPIPVATLVAN